VSGLTREVWKKICSISFDDMRDWVVYQGDKDVWNAGIDVLEAYSTAHGADSVARAGIMYKKEHRKPLLDDADLVHTQPVKCWSYLTMDSTALVPDMHGRQVSSSFAYSFCCYQLSYQFCFTDNYALLNFNSMRTLQAELDKHSLSDLCDFQELFDHCSRML
jgi:hypothetical protein